MLDESQVDQLVDVLVDRDVFVEDEDGNLSTTVEFERTRGVYYDTYMDVPEETFVETVSDLFGLDPSTAEERIEELGVTREQLVTYLALQSHLDDPPGQGDLAAMAQVAAGIGMDAVPPGLERVGDDDYASFLAEHRDAVLVVWSYPCAPCEEMKGEFDAVRAAAPDGVAFAGADGREVTALREEFDVEAAPTTLVFRDGKLAENVRGYHSPAELAEVFDEVYG